MGIQNAGTIIREARLKAKLTQEKLSDGICSVLSLSRIENGTAGVSPSTFQALMSRTGVACEALPIFANRTDFDCFYILKRADFYLEHWQLKATYDELNKIEEKNFAQNKYYYQEWLLLHCRLQFRSGCQKHIETYKTLLTALHISRPNIHLTDFSELLLSVNELKLLIQIAHECLYLDKLDTALSISNQLFTYLQNCPLTFHEKDKLLAETSIVYSKYLFATKNYSSALKISEDTRFQMINNTDNTCLHQLTFLTGLGYYYSDNTCTALRYFKTAFFSAHSIGSCYATTIYNYLYNVLNISLFDNSLEVKLIPFISYERKKVIDTSAFSDGIYDLFSQDTLTLGRLIKELRIEQNISQKTLCIGLCSKSKLSKIENNSLQPNIALAQSLLQRLGISDAIFTFYGSKHESNLQNLRLKLSHTPLSNKKAIFDLTKKLEAACSSKDTLYIQYASYRNACNMSISGDRTEALLRSIRITLSDFDFYNINNYVLSWLELTILNNYCKELCKITPAKGTLYFYQLLDFYEHSNLDILQKRRVFAILLCNLSSTLYEQQRFEELVELTPYFSSPVVTCSLNSIGVIYANYAQALGELHQQDLLTLFANYAYSNLLITNSLTQAELFKSNLYNDFHFILF